MGKKTLIEAEPCIADKTENEREDRLCVVRGTPLLVMHGRTMWAHCFDASRPSRQVRRLRVQVPNNNRIILKLEHLTKYSPTGSLYDRLYKHLFDYYENKGYIAPGITPLVEGSVGNAGAAFAYTACQRGYKNYTVLLPKDIYPSRIEQIKKLGAKVLFSPKNTAELGYIEIMEEMVRDAWRGRKRLRGDPERLFPVSKVLRIPNTPYAELVSEVVAGLSAMGFPTNIEFFLFGVGAGNTISEVGRALKARCQTKVIACEFKENPFVAFIKQGKKPPVGGPWPSGQIAETISGVPLDKLNLDVDIIDDVMGIDASQRDNGRRLANEDIGLFAGRPTGGILHGVFEVAKRVTDSNIFTIVFDSVSKYREYYEPLWDIDFANHRPLTPHASQQTDYNNSELQHTRQQAVLVD